MVVGNGAGVAALLAKPPATPPARPGDCDGRENTRHLVGAVNVTSLPIPPQAAEQLPPDIRPLLKAQSVAFAFTIGKEAKIELRAAFPDDASAADGLKAVRAAAEMAAPP